MDDPILEYSKTIMPSSINAFISDAYGMADELKHMVSITPEAEQSLGAAKIMSKWGCL